MQQNELALFAGVGGGILGTMLSGIRTVAAVEINEWGRRCMLQRQSDGLFEQFPIWDDVTTFDGRPWRGCVDIVSAGFPCQDVSTAGKREGIHGERSGLWFEACRVVREVRPRYVFIENTAGLLDRGMDAVLGSLASMGFDASWGVFSSCMFGAPHMRRRVFIVADAEGVKPGQLRRVECASEGKTPWHVCRSEDESGVARTLDGVANRDERCAAIGNGQDATVVQAAWQTLTGGFAAERRTSRGCGERRPIRTRGARNSRACFWLGGIVDTPETDQEIERQRFVEDYIESLTWTNSVSDETRAIVAGNLRTFWARVQGSNAELRNRYTEARQIAKRCTDAWYRDESEDGESAEDAMAELLSWVGYEELEDEILST